MNRQLSQSQLSLLTWCEWCGMSTKIPCVELLTLIFSAVVNLSSCTNGFLPALKARLSDDFMAADRPACTQLLKIIRNVYRLFVCRCSGSLLSSVFRVFLVLPGWKRGGGVGRGRRAPPVVTSYPDRRARARPVFSKIKNPETEINDIDEG